MTNRILFVDDDRRALDGYKRLLRGVFEIETAGSGIQGLATIHILGPFAVIVCDMRMTGMNGAEFLARVRELAPQTVRMLLTGYKDMDLAVEAVNDGQIFRYLNKPCSKDELVSAIRLGLAKYQSNAEDDELIKEARLLRMAPDLVVARVAQVQGARVVEGEPEERAALDRRDDVHRAVELDAVDLSGLTAGPEAAARRVPADPFDVVEAGGEDLVVEGVGQRVRHDGRRRLRPESTSKKWK